MSHNSPARGRMLSRMELLNGWEAFAAFMVIMLLGLIQSVYTRSGSGIGFHPYRKRGSSAPGAHRASSISGRDGLVNLTSRGTR